MYTVHKAEIILTVPSIEETAAWYERVLGWNGYCDASDAEGHCTFGSIMLGDMDSVMLENQPFTGFNLSRSQEPSSLYNNDHNHFTALINVDDVDAVYARVTKSGVVPESAPVDQPWGRIFSMRDCNGFTLTFFADVKDFTVGEIQQL
ncbi:MAG: VOC family protein [Anaerolineae bacterium]